MSVGYARVSTRDQLNDLESQKKLLEHSQIDMLLSDIGSGLNFNKLLLMILHREVKEVVLTRKKLLDTLWLSTAGITLSLF